MAEYCKGCGVRLQNEDPKALGYAPTLDSPYCQRCYRLRHYGDLTVNMQQGIESSQTLDKINAIDGTVFWVADLFDLEGSMISRLNQKLPGKKIVVILSKRDVLPSTLSDEKILNYVRKRLSDEGIEAADILFGGFMLKNSVESEKVLADLHEKIEELRDGGDVIFMGMANAGKSTLVNRFLESDDLTISRSPGTTLDVISVPYNGYTVHDTPGLENPRSVLSWLDLADLKTVIPTKPLKPYVCQMFEDLSFAAGGLARMDVVCKGKASVIGYFSLSVPIHRGKLADADRLWNEHLGEMLSPALDESLDTMQVYNAPKLKAGQKMDVVIEGLGWFCVSGDITSIQVRAHKGIQVTFRKAMI